MVKRSPKINDRGQGILFCSVPKGSVSLQLITKDGLPYAGTDLSIARIRKVSLAELVIRVGLNTPRKLISVLKLLISGNHRGESFRFARAVDELNSPVYSKWLRFHQRALAEAEPLEHNEKEHVLITVEEGTRSQIAVTLASLENQSWTSWRKIDREAINEIRSEQAGRVLWMNLPAGSVLDRNALAQLVGPFRSPDVAMTYSDEDVIGRLGRRHSPMFKPAWSPLLVQSNWMSLDGALVDLTAVPPEIDLKKTTVNQVALSISATCSRTIVHLPQVLLSRPSSTTRRTLQRTSPSQPSLPLSITIIIPTRDRRDLLTACIDGLREQTSGVRLEILIVDNDSRDCDTVEYLRHLKTHGVARVIPMPGDFNFSRACNIGVHAAENELILLLNNDVTPINPDWLEQLTQELTDPDVGAVGACLLYPDGLVQHAGVTLGAGSIARHSFAFVHPNGGEDRGLLNERRDVSAVTAACLLTTRSLWRSVDGMDEENLAVAFNDVDYCLKLRRNNKRVVWTPFAKLWHHESVSRGKDDTEQKMQRFAHEEATMYRRWGLSLESDPFHNPNLSKIAEDFALENFPNSLAARTSNWDC